MIQQKPKKYIIEKHVIASSVQDAIAKEQETPITSVFPASDQAQDKQSADCIGFKQVNTRFRSEY